MRQANGIRSINHLWIHDPFLVNSHVNSTWQIMNPSGHNFCTCHDSWAVVACANLWSGWNRYIQNGEKLIGTRFQPKAHIIFVKWVPGVPVTAGAEQPPQPTHRSQRRLTGDDRPATSLRSNSITGSKDYCALLSTRFLFATCLILLPAIFVRCSGDGLERWHSIIATNQWKKNMYLTYDYAIYISGVSERDKVSNVYAY